MRIANKISLSFFLLSAALIVTAMPFQYFNQKKDIVAVLSANLSSTIQSRGAHIETLLRVRKDKIVQLAQYAIFENFLKKGKQAEGYGTIFDEVVGNLERVKRADGFILEVFLLDNEGIVAVSTNKNEIGLSFPDESYFLGAKKGPYIKDAHYSGISKQQSFAFSAPVKDRVKGDFLGVLVMRIYLEELNEIVANRVGLGKTGETYLVNKYGYMITPSRSIKDAFLKQKVDTINFRGCYADSRKHGPRYHAHKPLVSKDYRGVKVLGTHYHIPEMKWCLLAEIDVDEAFASLIRLRNVLKVTAVIVLIMIIIVGGLVARVIIKPIAKLYEGMEIVGKGKLDYKVGTKAKDEIGRLSRAFDKMTEDLKRTTTSIDLLNKEITERKKAEKKVKEAMEIKTSFTSMVSHELRTPLTAIKEGINIVLDGITGKVNTEQKEFLGIAKRNIDRLTRLINDVLDFQKLEAGKTEFNMRENDINSVAMEVCNTLRAVIKGRGLKCVLNFDKSLPKIIFDRDRIFQVLANIANNALKFTEKGSIVFSTFKRGDNTVCVSVKDTGRGISREDLTKVFYEFEQLEGSIDRKTGSTGLGLAIAKNVIEKHKGKIWAESKPGKGSTFYFTLPIKERRR